jgi:tetratricopeptide (TPR) repeat protein
MKYLRKDGLSYRLVPVLNDNINTDFMYSNLMNKFGFGNANIPGVYFDEENRRHLQDIRQAYSELAINLVSKGRKEEARKVLHKADDGMCQDDYPYGLTSRNNWHNQVSVQFLNACYAAGDSALAEKVKASVQKDLQQQIKYYNSLKESNKEYMSYEIQSTNSLLSRVQQLDSAYKRINALFPKPHVEDSVKK